MATADPTWMEDIFLEVNRYGFMEETHFTIAYTLLAAESCFISSPRRSEASLQSTKAEPPPPRTLLL